MSAVRADGCRGHSTGASPLVASESVAAGPGPRRVDRDEGPLVVHVSVPWRYAWQPSDFPLGVDSAFMRAPRTLGLALVAVVSREAGAQHRGRLRAEDRPDTATIRRCGRPIIEWSADGWVPAQRLRWPPTSPCFWEAQQRARAIRAFQDSRIVAHCWSILLRMDPSVRDASVRITLTVDESGRFVNVALSTSPGPAFDTCIRAGLARSPSITAGPRVEAVTTVNLTSGG